MPCTPNGANPPLPPLSELVWKLPRWKERTPTTTMARIGTSVFQITMPVLLSAMNLAPARFSMVKPTIAMMATISPRVLSRPSLLIMLKCLVTQDTEDR